MTTLKMNENEPLICLKNVSYGYPGEMNILQKLDLNFYKGDRIGLVAPNGSGKTTLFHLIMGLLNPKEGEITLFGEPAREEVDFIQARKRIGLLFQDPDDQLFCPIVLEDVAFGPLNLGKSKDEAIEISRQTLNFLGLAGFENRVTAKLSGGEKRLVSLATVLAMSPEVLLLDEPVAGLDDRTKSILVEVLKKLALSQIIISHEAEFLTAATDHIYTLKDGRIDSDLDRHIHIFYHTHAEGTLPHSHG
jgi:cobalt/nickel transport system ATP-binding protein